MGNYSSVDANHLRIALAQAEAELGRRAAEKSFHSFLVNFAWPVLHPGIEFVDNWHIHLICEHLEAVRSRKLKRIIINVPFGTLKSTIVSQAFPAWDWIQYPGRRQLTIEATRPIAIQDAEYTKAIIESELFQFAYGDVFQLRDYASLIKAQYSNTRDGMRRVAALDDSMMNLRGDWMAIVDPISPNATDFVREKNIECWKAGGIGRLRHPTTGCIVVVQHRIHDRDFSGYLLAEESGWEHLVLPMRYDKKISSTNPLRGKRDPRKQGELLHPQRFGETEVQVLEASLGSVNASAQLQQTPQRVGVDISANAICPPFALVPSVVMDPNHPIHDLWAKARYKIFYGGRGGVKSWGVAEYLIRRASAEPVRILCTREFQNSIADSVHRLLTDTVARLGMESWFRVTQTSIQSRAGAEFIFKGLHNNVKEIKSTEGVDICWVEEAHDVSLESWETIGPTFRTDDSEIVVTFNTGDETSATHTRMVKNPPVGSIVHKINFDQNPFFTKALEEERQYSLSLIANAETDAERLQAQANYDYIWLGMTRRFNEAAIFAARCRYEAFDDELWKKADRLYFGADFGFARDPSTLIRFFVLDEVLYIEYEAHGIGIELDEMERFYDSVPLSREWPIKGDCSRPETISFMGRKGFRISAAEKWQGSVEDGVTHINGFKRIVIHPRCKHTTDEAKLYSYKVDRITREILPVIADAWNHCWDAVRYGLDGFIQKRGKLGMWERLGK